MIAHIRETWNVDDLLTKIADEVRGALPKLKEKCATNQILASQLSFIETSIEHFQKADYISSISVLYPRLEGIMRAHHLLLSRPNTKASQGNLADSLISVGAGSRHSLSLLLPDRFREFLAEVYFKDFNPTCPGGISRHTVSHGVAPSTDYNLKGAILGFLILDQISFFLGSSRT